MSIEHSGAPEAMQIKAPGACQKAILGAIIVTIRHVMRHERQESTVNAEYLFGFESHRLREWRDPRKHGKIENGQYLCGSQHCISEFQKCSYASIDAKISKLYDTKCDTNL